MHSSDGMCAAIPSARSQAVAKAKGIQRRKVKMGRASSFALGKSDLFHVYGLSAQADQEMDLRSKTRKLHRPQRQGWRIRDKAGVCRLEPPAGSEEGIAVHGNQDSGCSGHIVQEQL